MSSDPNNESFVSSTTTEKEEEEKEKKESSDSSSSSDDSSSSSEDESSDSSEDEEDSTSSASSSSESSGSSTSESDDDSEDSKSESGTDDEESEEDDEKPTVNHGITFVSLSSLNKQDEDQTTRERDIDKVAMFACPICFRVMIGKSNLRHHVTEMHEKTKGPPICTQCSPPKSFVNRDRLVAHIKMVHEKASSVTCPVCTKVLSHPRSLANHVKSKHHDQWEPGEDTRVECEQCGRRYPDRYSKERHVRVVHEGLEECQCHICDRKFNMEKNLKAHVKQVHYNEGRVACELCGQMYGTKSHKNRHIRQVHYHEPVNDRRPRKRKSNPNGTKMGPPRRFPKIEPTSTTTTTTNTSTFTSITSSLSSSSKPELETERAAMIISLNNNNNEKESSNQSTEFVETNSESTLVSFTDYYQLQQESESRYFPA